MAVDIPFHGEFTSADASALTEPNSRFSLYKSSDKAAITLAATEIVVITDYKIRSTAAITVSLYDGADTTVGNGERIAVGAFAATSAETRSLLTPHHCLIGTYPKIKGSGAGQIDAQISGFIRSTV